MSFFDSHAHLSGPELLPHIDEIMQRTKASGVSHILNICTDIKSLEEGLRLEERFPQILNAAAITPHDAAVLGEKEFSLFEQAALEGKLVAIGETGLEYFHPGLDREMQKKMLISHLHLAEKASLPVIFHCRDAFSDLFSIVDVEYPRKAKAILHCFTGTLHEAEEVLSRGWYLSLSGIVTFKKSEHLREVAKMVPLDQLLMETDAPYLAPQSKRSKVNEPSFILETASVIAEVKGILLSEVEKSTFSNASYLFQKKPKIDRIVN